VHQGAIKTVETSARIGQCRRRWSAGVLGLVLLAAGIAGLQRARYNSQSQAPGVYTSLKETEK